MLSLIQFGRRGPERWGFSCLGTAAVSALLLSALASPARAQGTQLNPVAQIEGTDVSVEGPSATGSDNERGGSSILVGSGSVVVVHSGKARLVLLTGGGVDICGPARFTVLQSGNDLTLAVELGRMRVRLPATVTLRLFTPTIVATPLEISGGARDVTVGLDSDDSLCVLAASGALQLEHQFSGEKLIVPQAGEFFLNSGKLIPVVGKSGGCQCAEMQSTPLLPAPTKPPDFAKASRQDEPILVPDMQLAGAEPPSGAPPIAASAIPEPSLEFSLPAHSNEAHPAAQAERKNNANVSPPAPSMPTYTVIAPLSFSSSAPTPPPDPPIDTYLLVREAQVQSSVEYKGHVDAPAFADAMQRALGQSGSAASRPTPTLPEKKRRGFWSFWRKIF